MLWFIMRCFSFFFSRYRRSCGRSAVCHLIGHVHRVPHAQEGRRILRPGRTQTEFAQLTSIQQEQSWILRLEPAILFLTKIRRQQNEGFFVILFSPPACSYITQYSLTQTFLFKFFSGWSEKQKNSKIFCWGENRWRGTSKKIWMNSDPTKKIKC